MCDRHPARCTVRDSSRCRGVQSRSCIVDLRPSSGQIPTAHHGSRVEPIWLPLRRHLRRNRRKGSSAARSVARSVEVKRISYCDRFASKRWPFNGKIRQRIRYGASVKRAETVELVHVCYRQESVIKIEYFEI